MSDINLNRLIMDTLRPLDVPVARLNYNQTADTYIVFLKYNEASKMNADDKEVITKHFYQVDVFSKSNFDNLVKQVKDLLKSVGFMRMFESETYDEEMRMNRAILRFNYENDIKNNTIRSD